MKLHQYLSVKLTIILIILTALFEVFVAYALSFLVVDTPDILLRNILILGLAYLLYGGLMYLNSKMRAVATYIISQDMKQKIDKYISQLSYQEFHQKDHGEHLSLYVNDVNKVLDLTLTKFFSMIEKATVTLFIFISLWAIHYSMALIALASFVLMAYVPSLFQKTLSKHILGVQEGKEAYLAKMRELLQGFDTFMENSAFTIFLKKSRQTSLTYATINLKADEFTSMMSAVLTVTNAMMTVLALAFLSYNVMKGRVQAGAFLSVTALLPSFGSAIMEFLSEKEFYQSGKTLYKTKFAMLEQAEYEEDFFYKLYKEDNNCMENGNFILQTNSGQSMETVTFKDLILTYPNKIIRFPQHLEFKEGKKYAIIGSSGCGKSTLLKILTGQVTDYQGTYLYNQSQPNFNPFEQMAYVNQTTFLFNDTLKNNVDFFNQHSDDEILRVLAALDLQDFQLDDVIIDNGKNLSGGQRQRLAIARAILRQKPLLLLDEATAALDKTTAKKVEQYLLKTSQSLIMVTHRLTPELEQQLDNVISLE